MHKQYPIEPCHSTASDSATGLYHAEILSYEKRSLLNFFSLNFSRRQIFSFGVNRAERFGMAAMFFGLKKIYPEFMAICSHLRHPTTTQLCATDRFRLKPDY